MTDSTASSDRIVGAQRSGAGTIKRIRLENFMCHSSLEIELCEGVNFITGQNGSGKSAILTALCIVFGCRAKETQRASKLKEFIKTGCSYAVVQVEIKNEGMDAFRPEIYGDSIFIERRITDSTSTFVLKDRQGKRVANRREDLRELVEHFNIDVENPCVIMSQDKSREFLHSGNDKDKFKFFFKATLLQQVDELLQSISVKLKDAYSLVDELEGSIKPIQLELRELQERIKNMERVEEMSRRIQQLKKLLAWLLVYEDDQKLWKQTEIIETLKNRIPACQAKIDTNLQAVEKLQGVFLKKKVEVSCLVEKTSELKRKKYELEEACRLATKEKLELGKEHDRHTKNIQMKLNQVRMLGEQAHDIQEKHIRNTQAEESEIEEQIKELENAVDQVKSRLTSLKDEENSLTERVSEARDAIKEINDAIRDYEKKQYGINRQISDLRLHQTNRVTAFGGDGVLRLLREIERYHHKFTKPPIGPIGAHLTLVNSGDTWAPAVEHAMGKLLNAFIVTNSNDASALRTCGREARYNYFPIIIHNFSRPRVNIPNYSLPQTKHPTTLSVLHSENPTVFNVLVDSGKAERQVLVKDYNGGKAVAFDQRIPNLQEVYTLDGFRMFTRGSVQTILPLNKNLRIGRLCGSFDDQIKEFERHGSNVLEEIEQCKCRKRELEKKVSDFESRLKGAKRRRTDVERDVTAKSLKLQDVRNSRVAEAGASSESTTNELLQEILSIKMEIQEEEALVETLREKMHVAEAKARSLELSHKELCESTKGEIQAFEKAEEELTEIERKINDAEARRAHYESVMIDKVLPSIKEEEAKYLEFENRRKDSYKKASVICPENEIKGRDGWDKENLEELNAEFKTLKQRLQHESQRYSESIDDIKMLYQEKEHKIFRKVQIYNAFRGKLDACQKALDLRWKKFDRNASYLKRQLTWKFNEHLGKKGISGKIKVSYEEKTLSVEVKMPQDASSGIVRDTRGLSGGERSFSTLCFTLSLHQMTEAPFRAMDEFDVFMDAVSRKISLDTLVEFALAQGSQWIFITPHDISMVKHGERIKKQEMAPPRA